MNDLYSFYSYPASGRIKRDRENLINTVPVWTRYPVYCPHVWVEHAICCLIYFGPPHVIKRWRPERIWQAICSSENPMLRVDGQPCLQWCYVVGFPLLSTAANAGAVLHSICIIWLFRMAMPTHLLTHDRSRLKRIHVTWSLNKSMKLSSGISFFLTSVIIGIVSLFRTGGAIYQKMTGS